MFLAPSKDMCQVQPFNCYILSFRQNIKIPPYYHCLLLCHPAQGCKGTGTGQMDRVSNGQAMQKLDWYCISLQPCCCFWVLKRVLTGSWFQSPLSQLRPLNNHNSCFNTTPS